MELYGAGSALLHHNVMEALLLFCISQCQNGHGTSELPITTWSGVFYFVSFV
jgi:hypothetical protein